MVDTSNRNQEIPSIWLVGNTQSGKSQFINMLMGEEVATVGDGVTSCTSCISTYFSPKYRLNLVDTPGLQDSYGAKASEATIQMLVNGLKGKRVTMILLLIKSNYEGTVMFDKSNHDALQTFLKILGYDKWKNFGVLLTHVDHTQQ